MTDPKKVLFYVLMAVGIVALAGAVILLALMYVLDKFDLVFIPAILLFSAIVMLVVASVLKIKIRRSSESGINHSSYNAPPPQKRPVDPFFTIDPFADAFTDEPEKPKPENKEKKSDKFCTYCGAPRVEGDKFCPFCGNKYE